MCPSGAAPPPLQRRAPIDFLLHVLRLAVHVRDDPVGVRLERERHVVEFLEVLAGQRGARLELELLTGITPAAPTGADLADALRVRLELEDALLIVARLGESGHVLEAAERDAVLGLGLIEAAEVRPLDLGT